MKYILILFTSFCFGQFNPIFFIANQPPNTFIGGVSATINTPALIAARLGISPTRIKSFRIVGANIEFRVTGGTYVSPGSMFDGNTSITYFKDNDRRLQSITNFDFRNCTNLSILEAYGVKNFNTGGGIKISNTLITTLYFPEMTSIDGNSSIQSNSLLTSFDAPNATLFVGASNLASNANLNYINIPKVLTKIGVDQLNNNNFLNIKIGCVINANVALQTSNAGAVDADLQYAITSRSAVVNWIP